MHHVQGIDLTISITFINQLLQKEPCCIHLSHLGERIRDWTNTWQTCSLVSQCVTGRHSSKIINVVQQKISIAVVISRNAYAVGNRIWLSPQNKAVWEVHLPIQSLGEVNEDGLRIKLSCTCVCCSCRRKDNTKKVLPFFSDSVWNIWHYNVCFLLKMQRLPNPRVTRKLHFLSEGNEYMTFP